MLTCGDGRGDLVEVIFSHEISFLHSIDRSWSAEHVLRLFDWADEHRARRAWSGFLAGGRINDDLLRAGLLQGILQTALRAKSFDKNSRNSLFQLSAQTALHSQLHPRDWVPRLIRNSDVEGRALWADHIGEYLRDLQPQEAEAQWARWLKAYWESRIESVPRRLDLSEASFMAQWIVHLTESAQEGINLVLQRPAGLTPYSRLLGHIDEQTVQRDPGTWAEFVSHLLSNTDLPFYGGYELPNVLRCLETCGADAISLNAIREQALRLGLPLDD
jgi:hypothetical protein